MGKPLFSITCTTCRARLAVRNQQSIGVISECPTCGSMVQILPPEDWQPPTPTEPPPDEASEPTPSQAPADRPAAGAPSHSATKQPAAGPSPAAASASPASAEPAAAGTAPARGAPEKAAPAAPRTAATTRPVAGQAPPVVRPAGAAAEDSSEALAAAAVPLGLAAAPAEMLWRKWLWIATAPVVGLVVVVGAWSIFFSSSENDRPPAAVESPVEPAAAETAGPDDAPKALPTRIDPRWVPDRTTMAFCFQPSRMVAWPNSGKLFDAIGPLWRPLLGSVGQSLGLKPNVIRRITCAVVDLGDWPEQAVALVELEPSADTAGLTQLGHPLELPLAGATCRQLARSHWPYALVILDRHTLVVGSEPLVRHLATRSEPHFASVPIGRLLKRMLPDGDLTLLVDLAAARAAGWELPAGLLDVWSPGRDAWHVICEMPVGLGGYARGGEQLRVELALVCEGETAANAVEAALGELAPAVRESLSARAEEITRRLRAGEINAATAQEYELLLKEGLVAAQSARWEISDETVWLRLSLGHDAGALSAAAAESRPAIHDDYLQAARQADEANQERLMSGLVGYRKAEGRFPDAASNSAVLAPETRLSWIAEMLPYFGHTDWHRELEFGYRWNGPQNRGVTARPLPEVVNPALGPSQTEAGFPVTHYVGVAGVGEDAAELKADDPRAGVFGYGRRVGSQDIADGASNTIAVLGASGQLGPWAAGGRASVRPLTQQPYVNGPDGFGSGQPDGMLAGMADGSVRFVCDDVDPRVIEQLATIGGHEDVSVASLDRRAMLPGPLPPGRQIPDPASLEPAPPLPGPSAPPVKPATPQAAEANAVAEKPPLEPEIDVAAHLGRTIAEVELTDVPLGKAARLVASLSGVPLTFDPEAMTQLGVTLSDPVSAQLSGATAGRILHEIVSQRGLAYVVDGGQVWITSPPETREKLFRVPYSVDDLTGPEPVDAADLALAIRTMVAPDSWRSGGGRGTIEPQAGTLSIEQTGDVHAQVVAFCEKLRNARGLPLRSRLEPDRFTLTPRTRQAADVLRKPLTANFYQRTPLGRILDYLGEAGGVDVLVDRPALAAAGISADMETTLDARQQPLGEALAALLKPLGLACRVIDGHTLQVTTAKAVAARLELEFYPVVDLLVGGQTAAGLSEAIKSRVAGSTWADAGGPGALHFDAPSQCLIVLQSQPVQAAVAGLLDEWRAK